MLKEAFTFVKLIGVNSSANKGRGSVADEVLAYLASHEEAEDTLEGVAQWWLLDQQIQRATRDVKAALEELVTKDFVSAWRNADGRVRYRLNQAKLKSIKEHLQQSGASGASAKKR